MAIANQRAKLNANKTDVSLPTTKEVPEPTASKSEPISGIEEAVLLKPSDILRKNKQQKGDARKAPDIAQKSVSLPGSLTPSPAGTLLSDKVLINLNNRPHNYKSLWPKT